MINVKNPRYIKAFGKNLSKLRKEKGFTQEALFYEADVNISQIGRAERGEINVTISTIYAIANALKVNPKALLDFNFKK